MIVFGVKYRVGAIVPSIREGLYNKIRDIIADYGRGTYLVAIGGVADHIHILVGLSPKISLEELVREIKSRSTRWINSQDEYGWHFEWQRGYGAFSYSQSARPNVINYINQQEDHHRHLTFREEVEKFFERYGIVCDPRDLPD